MQDRQFKHLGRSARTAVPAVIPGGVERSQGATRRFFGRRWFVGLGLGVGILLVGGLAYAYLSTQEELRKLLQLRDASQQELVAQISQHLVLPQEEPVVATINDVGKLAGQEFFKNAQNGDKVLVFPKANKALIYRPASRKVIEYSKVNLDGLQGQPKL